MTMLPPTAATLSELEACRSIAAVMAAKRPIKPRRPVVLLDGDRAWLSIPDVTVTTRPGPTAPVRGPAAPSAGIPTARARPALSGAQPVPDDAGRHQHLADRRPGLTVALVVDPGPDDEGHLRRVRRAARAGGSPRSC